MITVWKEAHWCNYQWSPWQRGNHPWRQYGSSYNLKVIWISKFYVCRPCVGWGRVSQESIAANEEDDIGAAQGWDVFKPEKLHTELVKEVCVDEQNDAEEKVADIRDQNQQLPSRSVAPGSKEECKDDAGNLEDRWQKLILEDKITCLIKLETISTLATTVCTYSCSSGKVPLKRLSHTCANNYEAKIKS